jgi:hypothetical protein
MFANVLHEIGVSYLNIPKKGNNLNDLLARTRYFSNVPHANSTGFGCERRTT